MPEIAIDQRYLRPLQSVGRSLEMKEVPLLIIGEGDQSEFVRQVTSVIGGRALFSGAPDAAAQLLASIRQATYLFLTIEDVLPSELIPVIDYYLESRDVMPGDREDLLHTFKDHPIHDDHRLILLIDRAVLQTQPSEIQGRLMQICTKIFFS